MYHREVTNQGLSARSPGRGCGTDGVGGAAATRGCSRCDAGRGSSSAVLPASAGQSVKNGGYQKEASMRVAAALVFFFLFGAQAGLAGCPTNPGWLACASPCYAAYDSCVNFERQYPQYATGTCPAERNFCLAYCEDQCYYQWATLEADPTGTLLHHSRSGSWLGPAAECSTSAVLRAPEVADLRTHPVEVSRGIQIPARAS